MNVAIIGCGGMGTLHARMARNCGLNIVACGDTNKARAKTLAADFDAEASTNCEALIARDDVDIICVTTPTPMHTPYVTAAARAGKHIFCEKPFGRTLNQCQEALAAVEKAGVKLFVAHVVRYFQDFEAIRQQVQSGQVGKPGFIKTYRGGIFPQGENHWYHDYEQSGGVTLDCIIHDFDWIRYLFGNPSRVFCQTLQRPDALDYAQVTLRMEQGVIAHTIGSWAHPAGFRMKVEISGDQGLVTYDSNEAPVTTMKREVAGGEPGMIVPGSPVPKSPYQLEWEDFLGWINGESEPRVTPEDAVWAVRIALAALESAKSGQPVAL